MHFSSQFRKILRDIDITWVLVSLVLVTCLLNHVCADKLLQVSDNHNNERRFFKPSPSKSSSKLPGSSRQIDYSFADLKYNYQTSALIDKKKFPDRRLIYGRTKPINVRKALRKSNGEFVNEKLDHEAISSWKELRPTTQTISNNSFVVTKNHSLYLRRRVNSPHLAGNSNQNHRRKSIFSPIVNYTSASSLSINELSSSSQGSFDIIRDYKSNKTFGNNHSEENRSIHYFNSRKNQLIAELKPPPGFRLVVVENNGDFPTNRRTLPKIANIQVPQRQRKVSKVLKKLHAPVKTVLRIQAQNIKEARELLTHIGPGFKVTLINNGTNQLQPESDVTLTPTNANTTIATEIVATSRKVQSKSSKIVLTRGQTRSRWWEGNHVCVKESPGIFGLSEIVWKKIKTSKSCIEKKKRYVCTEKYGFGEHSPMKTTSYRCCSGYRININKQICQPRSNYRNVSLKTEFVERIGYADHLGPPSTTETELLTIFMPSDDVVIQAFVSRNSFDVEEGSMVRSFLENHVIPKVKLLSNQMFNNQILTAVSGNPIRVNFFPSNSGNIMTANCRKVVTPDTINDNTVIHFIDRIIETVDGSFAEYLQNRRENFSTFLTVFENSKLPNLLRSFNRSYTLLVPTNEAFEHLHFQFDDTGACNNALALNHIVDGIVCTASFNRKKRIITTLQNEHEPIYQISKQNYIDDARIISSDIMTANGVIQVIDRVLKPSSGSTVLDVLKSYREFSYALNMFQIANMTEALETGSNFTLIVPNNKAYRKISKQTKHKMKKNKKRLQSMLMFHLLPLALDIQNLQSMSFVETLYPPYNIHTGSYPMKIRVPSSTAKWRYIRKTAKTLQCAKITKQLDRKPCNGAIFVINKFIKPPTGTLLSMLMYSKKSNFTTLLQAIRIAGVEQILDGDSVFTMFAPSEAAFDRLPSWIVQRLLNNKKLLIQVLKFHIIPGFHCQHELLQRSYRHTTLLQSTIITCPKKKRLYLGRRRRLRAKVIVKNIIASNGIIHAIDNLLLPPNFKLI